jgi:hypothetical protein
MLTTAEANVPFRAAAIAIAASIAFPPAFKISSPMFEASGCVLVHIIPPGGARTGLRREINCRVLPSCLVSHPSEASPEPEQAII